MAAAAAPCVLPSPDSGSSESSIFEGRRTRGAHTNRLCWRRKGLVTRGARLRHAHPQLVAPDVCCVGNHIDILAPPVIFLIGWHFLID